MKTLSCLWKKYKSFQRLDRPSWPKNVFSWKPGGHLWNVGIGEDSTPSPSLCGRAESRGLALLDPWLKVEKSLPVLKIQDINFPLDRARCQLVKTSDHPHYQVSLWWTMCDKQCCTVLWLWGLAIIYLENMCGLGYICFPISRLKFLSGFYFYLYFSFNCCSSTVVSIFTSPHPPPHPSPPPTFEPTHFGFAHVSFIHVPWWTFPYFLPLSLSSLPSVTVSLFFISMFLVIFAC